MSVDFKIKIKNQIQEFDKLQEATEKKTDKKYRDCEKTQMRKKKNYSNR
jgi:hypothetical protein